MFLTMSSYTEAAVVLGVVFIISYLCLRRNPRRRLYRTRRPPVLPWLPIVGSLPFMPQFKDLHTFFLRKSKTIGGVFAFNNGRRFTVVLNTREAVEEALVKKASQFADRPALFTDQLLCSSGQGILFGKYGPSFKKYHQLVLNILKQFGFGDNIMEERIKVEVEDLLNQFRGFGGEPFDPHSLSISSTQNVINIILFGKRIPLGSKEPNKLKSILAEEQHLYAMLLPVNTIPILRFLPRFRRLSKRLSDVDREILDHYISLSYSDKTSFSFINCFRDSEGDKYDRSEMAVIVRDLNQAGTDSSSIFVLWAIVAMANHVDAQRRLQEEIDSVVGRDRLPSLQDLPKLPYVEAAILEIFRYRTVSAFGMPHQTTCDTSVGGFDIPASTMVMVNLYAVHNDPDVWDNPSEFRPERFLDSEGHVTGRDRIVPFSLGTRSCLGEMLARQETFLFFTSLLQNFDIRPPEGQDFIDCQEVPGQLNEASPFLVRFIDRA